MSLWNSFTSFISKDSKKPTQQKPLVDNIIAQNKLAKKSIHFHFDFDRWYPTLEPITFKSRILPISPKMAEAMVHFYQTFYNINNTLTEQDIVLLKKLDQCIERAITKMKCLNGVFVRMSNRSPKDGAPLLDQELDMTSIYKNALDQVPPQDDNQKLIVLTDLQMQLLKCNHSPQVMNLILTSERVYADLNLALDCHQVEPEDEWSTSLILREWEPQLRQENEFRVFVYQGKVTAISQYNYYCKYPSLNPENKDFESELSERIVSFVNKVHALIGQDDYVIDLALIGDDTKVIELNPFDKTTGGCLFSWKEDQPLLQGLEGPCLRIRHEEDPKSANLIKMILGDEFNQKSEQLPPYTALLHPSKPKRKLG